MKRIYTLLGLTLFSSSLFAQWQEENCGLTTQGRGFEQIVPVSATVVWATAFDVSGADKSIHEFTRTEDGGVTWIPGEVTGVPSSYNWSCLTAISNDTAWAAFKDDSTGVGGAVYRTYDGGNSWTKLNVFSSQSVPRILYFFDGSQGIAIGDPVNNVFEIYATSDGGDTWDSIAANKIPVPLQGEKPVKASFEARGNKFYFGSSKGRLFVTQDKGHDWDANNVPGFSGSIDKVISTDNKSFILRQHEEGSSEYLFTRTLDGGITWNTLVTDGPFYAQNICKVPNTDHTLVSCGWDANVAIGSSYSITFGEGWIPLDTGIQHTGLAFFDNDHGWSGGVTTDFSTGGIYNFTGYFFAVGIEETNAANPPFAIYPNPAADQITLQLNSDNLSANEILVTDIAGRLIYSQKISHLAPGDLMINVSEWSEGVYVVQLRSGKELQTQKLIVSR